MVQSCTPKSLRRHWSIWDGLSSQTRSENQLCFGFRIVTVPDMDWFSGEYHHTYSTVCLWRILTVGAIFLRPWCVALGRKHQSSQLLSPKGTSLDETSFWMAVQSCVTLRADPIFAYTNISVILQWKFPKSAFCGVHCLHPVGICWFAVQWPRSVGDGYCFMDWWRFSVWSDQLLKTLVEYWSQ